MGINKPSSVTPGRPGAFPAAAADREATESVDRLFAKLLAVAEAVGAEAALDVLMEHVNASGPEDPS